MERSSTHTRGRVEDFKMMLCVSTRMAREAAGGGACPGVRELALMAEGRNAGEGGRSRHKRHVVATVASYFTRVSKARVQEAVTEAVNPEEAGRIAGFMKGDMAEAAERLVEGKGWLPSVLRTMSDAAEPADGGTEGPGDDEAYSFAAE